MSPAPLLILAPPCSGAEVWAARLHAAGAYALPTLHRFLADRLDDWRALLALSQQPLDHALLRVLAEVFEGGQDEAALARARARLAARPGREGAEPLLRDLAAGVAPRRLVLVEVDAPSRPADLRRLAEALPAATVLQLLRHPWTQGRLQHHLLADRLFIPADVKDHAVEPPRLDPQLGWWRAHHNLDQRLRPHWPAARWWVVDEAAGEAALDALAARLGLATPLPAAAAAWPAWPFAGWGPRSAPYGGEEEPRSPDPVLARLRAEPPAPFDQPLPWRADGRAFAPEVVALYRRLEAAARAQ
ncbi:MAG TPA: hypothetical protein VFV27_03890 [Nevskiaceae bacterium]|nr:hypothetical protein [Nevskiaceae bacterium]